jgi:hypothetical protein
MEMTLLTLIFAGPQEALAYQDCVHHFLVCTINPATKVFPTHLRAKKTTSRQPCLSLARYYLERQTSASPV